MGPALRRTVFLLILAWAVPIGVASAEDVPLTRDVPIQQYQAQPRDKPYDYNAPPEGMFNAIQFARGFDEEIGFRRTYEITPLERVEVFQPDDPAVYVIFRVYPHYQSYEVIGICFPEQVDGAPADQPIARDAMHLALEDDTGYLKLDRPVGGWKPGRYKVEIHVGYQVTHDSLMGTMRFTVADAPHPTGRSSRVPPATP